MPVFLVIANVSNVFVDVTRAVVLGGFGREEHAAAAVLLVRARRDIPHWHVSYAVVSGDLRVLRHEPEEEGAFEALAERWAQQLKAHNPAEGPADDSDDEGPPGLISDDEQPPALVSDDESCPLLFAFAPTLEFVQ